MGKHHRTETVKMWIMKGIVQVRDNCVKQPTLFFQLETKTVRACVSCGYIINEALRVFSFYNAYQFYTLFFPK